MCFQNNRAALSGGQEDQIQSIGKIIRSQGKQPYVTIHVTFLDLIRAVICWNQ